MQIFEDVNREDVFIVSFDNADWEAIKREALRTQRLLKVIVLEVLSYGVQHYPYTKKKDTVP